MAASRRGVRGRSAVVLLGVLLVAVAFLTRLVDVQVVQAADLRAESKDRRQVTTVLPGSRGRILDADGTVLAASVTRFEITASPRLAAETGGVPAAAASIAAALGVDAASVTTALTADPASEYAMVAERAPLAAYERIRALDLPWLTFRAVPVRTYPAGSTAGNLVGFVGADQKPQAGVEYALNACLQGSDGSAVAESGLDGTPIPGTSRTVKAARQGGTVRLTIDRDLQYAVQRILAARAKQTGAKWGSVVVMDSRTGALKAVADWPTVDPSDVSATADADPGALGSRAFTAPFEPGSTMKTVTAAMLLDRGLATPRTRVVVPYRLTTADGADVNDSEVHATEHLTTTGVLVQSSNTGISQLGADLSDADRYAMLKAFGFGSPTEVGFGAEAGGDLGAGAPDWDAQSRLATMFGQGLTTTAVQMASAYQTIANGGVRMPVRLVESCTDADGTVHRVTAGAARRVVSASAARGTVRMLENVATKGWLAADVRIPGYRVGIKTGTAQESDGHGGYSTGYLVSMAGVAPADDPRYVVYVDLDAPSKMNTSQATAPVFQQVMSRVLQADGVVPSGSSSPDLPTTW